MPTQCRQEELDFGSSGGRKLVGAFDGGAITSNGGSVLLAATDKRIGLAERLAGCFIDHRSADRVEHALVDLLRQRIFGIALGHEDLIDHDALRFDPALTAVLGKPGGWLAGKSTLNRLEHAAKIGRDRHLLAAKLRPSSVDAADGSVAEVTRIVAQIRARWPTTTIVVRADSGFCRDDLMTWCEANDVQYVLGLAGNSRLVVNPVHTFRPERAG
ncbi:MAG: transposase [Hyphomicrobium sp.]|nr:transposase [Hyphomicrobium sp.]